MDTTARLTHPALAAVVAAVALATPAYAQPHCEAGAQAQLKSTRTEDVVYGRRDGLALTMDVFTPEKPNGAGVIIFVSAEFRSGRDVLGMFHPHATAPFLDRGYVLFLIMHGSQPKYTVPEMVEDAHRAVRFIKHSAKKYDIDPAKLGVSGGSSGGHLALMIGCAGRPGDPAAADPVERQSSRVAAVACVFPPTDFLALAGPPRDIAAAFDFRERNRATGKLERVTAEREREIGRAVSPVTYAAKGAAPTLIIHGEKDTLVPVAQSKTMIDKLKGCGVECKLVVKANEGHFGAWILKDLPALADWYDLHLLGKK